MAAPDNVNMKALSGYWVMNKTLSDDTDSILAMQGIGWFMRKAISLATVTLRIHQYVADDGKTHIDIDQTATGGIKGTSEMRTLDWEKRAHDDHIFGELVGQSRWRNLDEIDGDDLEFLKGGWRDEVKETGLVESFVVNEKSEWTARQIWGFEDVEGQRYYCRHVVVKKGEETKTAKLFYDYTKALEDEP